LCWTLSIGPECGGHIAKRLRCQEIKADVMAPIFLADAAQHQ
jgi:hypothetical protein